MVEHPCLCVKSVVAKPRLLNHDLLAVLDEDAVLSILHTLSLHVVYSAVLSIDAYAVDAGGSSLFDIECNVF